jgi:AraC-like DNA-binding protein
VADPYAHLRIHTRPVFYRCEPSWHWQPPPLVDYDIWIVTHGRGSLTVNGVVHPLEPDRVFVLRPGDRPVGRQEPQDRLRVFALHLGLYDPAGRLLDPADAVQPPPGHKVRDPAMLAGLMQGAVLAWRRGGELGQARATLYARLILMQLLAESQAPPGSDADSRIGRLLNAILEEPSRHWRVPDLARDAGLSRAQFTRRFTALAGMPPARFVIHARVSRATTLLRETDLTLAAIAAALGSSDLYYFARQYRHETTRTPGQTRRLARG